MNKHQPLHELQQFTQHALDFVFPPICTGCGSRGTILCAACRAQFLPLVEPICQHCGSPVAPPGMLCRQCHHHRFNLSGLRAASSYAGPLRKCIHDLKYEGNLRLAQPLGLLLAQAYTHYGMQVDLMIPVPLHKERELQRGYNHAYLLAEVCANRVQVPLYNDILVRHKHAPAQVGLAANARYQNVAGAFTCSSTYATGALMGRTILLIDDVFTTGATLEACAVPLFAAGVRAVWGLVLARPL